MPVRQFLADVARVAAALGGGAHVLNICADRYSFTVGLAASLVSGKVSLLPATRTPEVIAQLARFAPDVICLTDEAQCDIELPRVLYPAASDAADSTPRAGAAVPLIDSGQTAAWVFTSGSTGAPVPHRKTFGRLRSDVREEARRLGLLDGRAHTVVATVPPQHMYGFESSVLAPLATGNALCAERPFYPADICSTLAAVPRPRLLISTPIHLRALLGAGLDLPAVDLIVCSTAPLAGSLAAEVEQRFGTTLIEIYGSTETGQIATRRPTLGAEWHLWPGVELESRGNEVWARGGHVEQPTRMWDVLELTGEDRFLLHGRLADLVNIAGKRSSLAYLSHQLAAIPGVEDGAFFHPVQSPDAAPLAAASEPRVAACVVAPGLSCAQILAALRERIDPVFLPRPLLLVDSLPRTAAGKLPQEALRALAAASLKAAPKSAAGG
ncbi:MAG: AMP-binding protein [Steroidobacteraceae bacterium]